MTLADLSHATLVEHAEQLQKDYNKLDSVWAGQTEDLEDDLEEVQAQLYEASQDLKDKEKELSTLQAKLDRAFEDIEQLEKNAQEQARLKNKHIDLHVTASARANTAEADLKMVRTSLEEVSGHLREAVEESERLDTENQKMNIALEAVRQSNTRKNKQIDELLSDLENHPANVRNKAALAELRYKTLQTTIRWGAFFASVFSIGYHLA